MFNAEIPDFFVATNFFPFAFILLGFFVFFHCSFLLTMRNKQRENAYDSALLLLLLLLLLAFLFYFCSIHSANHRHHRQILYVCTVSLSLWYLSPMKINKLFICHLLKWNNSKNNAKSTLFFTYFLFLFK